MDGPLTLFGSGAARWALRLAWVLTVALITTAVSAGDKAMAESLFQRGKAAMASGDYIRGCSLLAASFEQEPAVGTLLNLALCHAKQGKTATAWAEFREAAAMAERQGQTDRAKGAREYAAKLERALSMLTITVAEPVDGLVVTRQGVEVPPASYGVPIATDPGRYRIEATAPGHQSWSKVIEIAAHADRRSVTVPRLPSGSGTVDRHRTDEQPLGEQPANEQPTEDSPRRDSRTSPVLVTGIVIGGIGVVALGVGIALGAMAMSDTDELDQACPTRTGCEPDVLSRRDSVATRADVATGTIISGSAAVAAGLLMILLAPDGADDEGADRAAVRFVPQLGGHRVGLGITGAF